MTQDSVAIPAKQYYVKRVRHYLTERGLDEEVLAAVPVRPAGFAQATFTKSVAGALGTVAGDVLGAAGGVNGGSVTGMHVGNMVGTEINARRADTGQPSLPLPKLGYLMLTSGRLLVFANSQLAFFTAKPKESYADIRLADVFWVSEPVSVAGGGPKVVQFAIGLRGGYVMRFEFPAVSTKTATALAAELTRRIGQGEPRLGQV